MCCRNVRDWCMALRLRCYFAGEGCCKSCWEEDGCLHRMCNVILGFIVIPFYLLYLACRWMQYMYREVGARTSFCRGFDRPFLSFFVISLSVALNSMLADGYSFLDFPGSKVVCYAPVLLLNLEFTVLLCRRARANPPEDADGHQALAFCLLQMLLWNAQFVVLAVVGDDVPYMEQLAPLMLFLCVYLIFVSAKMVEDDDETCCLPIFFHFLFFWSPIFVQLFLIAAKLDGKLNSASWNQVLAPWWIMCTIVLVGIVGCFEQLADGHHIKARFLVALTAALCSIIAMANRVDASYAPPLLTRNETRALNLNVSAPSGRLPDPNWAPPSYVRINAPLVVGALFLAAIRLYLFLVSHFCGLRCCLRWVRGARQRWAQASDEHSFQAQRKLVTHDGTAANAANASAMNVAPAHSSHATSFSGNIQLASLELAGIGVPGESDQPESEAHEKAIALLRERMEPLALVDPNARLSDSDLRRCLREHDGNVHEAWLAAQCYAASACTQQNPSQQAEQGDSLATTRQHAEVREVRESAEADDYVPALIEHACTELGRPGKSTHDVVQEIRRLKAQLMNEPRWQTAGVRSRIVRIGQSKADANEWPNEAKEEFGKLLRAMHPVNMIRRRLRYYVGQGGKTLSGRLRAMSSDSGRLHRNSSAASDV